VTEIPRHDWWYATGSDVIGATGLLPADELRALVTNLRTAIGRLPASDDGVSLLRAGFLALAECVVNGDDPTEAAKDYDAAVARVIASRRRAKARP